MSSASFPDDEPERACSENPLTRERLARSSSSPMTLELLVHDSSSFVRLALLDNPHLELAMLDALLTDPDRRVRERLAQHGKITAHQALLLSRDPAYSVRHSLAKNPSVELVPEMELSFILMVQDSRALELISQATTDLDRTTLETLRHNWNGTLEALVTACTALGPQDSCT